MHSKRTLLPLLAATATLSLTLSAASANTDAGAWSVAAGAQLTQK